MAVRIDHLTCSLRSKSWLEGRDTDFKAEPAVGDSRVTFAASADARRLARSWIRTPRLLQAGRKDLRP